MSWFKETKAGQVLYRSRELNQAGVCQAFSAKAGGNMALHTGDDPEMVVKRRRAFLGAIGLDLNDLVAGVQTHGVNVRLIGRDLSGAGAFSPDSAIPDSDAFITREPGVILSIFTADCLPVFLYDPVTPAIGLAHAGWRGTLNGIVARTLEAMTAAFKTDPVQCRVTIGPAIGTECFSVTKDVAGQFAAVFPETVTVAPSTCRVDLAGFNRKLLERLGVPGRQITSAALCTSCLADEFYSYRADRGTPGRMMGVIQLKRGE